MDFDLGKKETRKYRTVVADPPWEVRRSSNYSWRAGCASGKRMDLPYPTLTVPQIAALPVSELAASDAHLYLWTIQGKLEQTFGVARAWGFKVRSTLIWCKPRQRIAGGTFCSNTEFVLFCRRGELPANDRVASQWFTWPRGEHSAKPDEFMRMVEKVSPGPYLELFAREYTPMFPKRAGWDVWGNEVAKDVEMEVTEVR